ncbi:MAG TPA: hypothetical protein VGL77_08260 [Armatimonadota bacterium]|jgi:hypothetical protein
MTQRASGVRFAQAAPSPRSSRRFRVFGIATLLSLIAGLGLPGLRASAAAARQKAVPAIVAQCRADLAQRLECDAQGITLVEAQATVWPNAALGMPERDKAYAQVQTPGWKITLEALSDRYLYTASARTFRYGGPVATWAYSALYLVTVPDEPNMNGDLYQCSLAGTNTVRLISGVTDYYPQANGIILAKRRTSRSSHELLYVKADGTGKTKTLYGAFDLGEAAINGTQDTWAGFVRPMVGAAWNVVVARVGQDGGNALTLPLPDGVRTGKIAWSGEKLMILVTKDERTTCFEITPAAGAANWKEVNRQMFPGQRSYMLNKSAKLEITQVNNEGKPGVEVASVWFTGDRNVMTRISGVTLRGYELLSARFVLIWGEADTKQAAYTVDIATGKVVLDFRIAGQNMKPFKYAPVSKP